LIPERSFQPKVVVVKMPFIGQRPIVIEASAVEVLQEEGGPYRVEHQNLGHGHGRIGWRRFCHAGVKSGHAHVIAREDSGGE
jgi:hypothetical protein